MMDANVHHKLQCRLTRITHICVKNHSVQFNSPFGFVEDMLVSEWRRFVCSYVSIAQCNYLPLKILEQISNLMRKV